MHSSKTNITSAGIVATPTLRSWSQIYSAGTLFAVFSLTTTEPSENLPATGKELMSALEEEYFTLEEKTLETIKQAVSVTWEKFPKDHTGCLTVAAIINNVSYLFAAGQGSVVLKRAAKMGTILVGHSDQTIASASGYVDSGDLLILQTKQFATHISIQTFLTSQNTVTPTDIVENISPKIHQLEDGASAAMVLLYEEPKQEQEEGEKEENEPEVVAQKEHLPGKNYLAILREKIVFPRLPVINIRLGGSKKVMLLIAIILFGVLIGGVYITKKQQQEKELQASYAKLSAAAEKKFEEGQSLVELNKNLARDDFAAAQKILTEGKTKFPKDSVQAQGIDKLLKRVNDALLATAAVNSVQAKEASEKDSPLLTYEVKNSSSGTSYSQDTANVYVANKTGILSIDKKTLKEKTLVKNTDTWTTATSLGTYLSNFYVLDSGKNQLLKLAAIQNGYGRANYLASGVTADFSKAVSLSIDGSVWVLSSDGSIQKFTRGKPDTFTLSGLDSPLTKPVKIVTGADTDKLYVLDTGQARIVVINKNGAYHEQYQTETLKKAVDFEVKEKDKKLLFLSSGKIWQIDLK